MNDDVEGKSISNSKLTTRIIIIIKEIFMKMSGEMR